MKPMMMLPAVTAKVSSSFGPSLMICRTSHLNSMSRIIAGSSAVRRVSPTASMSPWVVEDADGVEQRGHDVEDDEAGTYLKSLKRPLRSATTSAAEIARSRLMNR